MSRLKLLVTADSKGMKLLPFLKKSIEQDLSNRKIKFFIDSGCCSVNGRTERFHHTVLKEGDRILLSLREEQQESLASTLTMQPLFEDKDIIAYTKPVGLVCDQSTERRLKAFLVHRLDKDTSGVLLFAKNIVTRDLLFTQFRERQMKKEYVAIVAGQISQDAGVINNCLTPISRFQGGTMWGVRSYGEQAITRWKVEQRGKKATLVRLFPETGKTHQLRVHMRFLGHPILGDPLYGSHLAAVYPTTGQLLHAEQLLFQHPITKNSIEIRAPLPEHMNKAIIDLCAT